MRKLVRERQKAIKKALPRGVKLLGHEVTKSTHIKWILGKGNDRRFVLDSNTPSDHRGGKNFFRDLKTECEKFE